MKKGLVQLYYGNGKGKTTAAVGQAVRAAGRGLKVLFTGFLKTDDSGELTVLRKTPNITVGDFPPVLPFYFMMSDKEKEQYNRYAAAVFADAKKRAEEFDVIVMDEVADAVSLGIIPEATLTDFMKNKPDSLELVLTGHSVSDALCSAADYVSEVKAIKHPFDSGVAARKGIEF